MSYYINAIRNYFNFSGRATRKEFFSFFIINLGIIFVTSWFYTYLLVTQGFSTFTYLVGAILFLYLLFITVPLISITVRRLHDVGKSGYYYFVILIPFFGFIWLMKLLFAPSDCDNKYGPNKYGKKCN